MSEVEWAAIDRYLEERHVPADEALEWALRESDAAGLPQIAVSATQGKQLFLLAKAVGAKSILEIGTLGGYSAIWMARALEAGGKLITIEADARHAEVAKSNFEHAGVGDKVEIWIGEALKRLPQIAAAVSDPLDFAFIDADKANIPDYFDWTVRMSRPGALIVVDNVIRRGRVIDPDTGDADVDGVRRFLDLLADDQRVEATTVQTVGVKGHDGFTMAHVR